MHPFAVLFFLALALLALLAGSYDLVTDKVAFPKVQLWECPGPIFGVFVAISLYRGHKLRKDYPMGVLGSCLVSLVLVLKIAAHWMKGSEMQLLLWVIMMAVSILSSALILRKAFAGSKGESDWHEWYSLIPLRHLFLCVSKVLGYDQTDDNAAGRR